MKKIVLVVGLFIIVALGWSIIGRRRERAQLPAAPAVYQVGDYREALMVNGRERSYLLHLPIGFDGKTQYPLLVGFHGGNGSGEKFAGQTGLSVAADRKGFIAVFPDGIEHNWNDGRDTTDAFKAGADDVKFVRLLVEDLKKK